MSSDPAVWEILPTLVSKGLLAENAIDIFDLDYFDERISRLKSAFPEPFILHCLAIKANPMRGIVQWAKNRQMGAETASLGETLHALSLGIEPSKIVFDSPCKTRV